MSANELWQQYIEGDNQVLGKLYRPMFRRLFFVAFRYTHDEESSHDLIQDLFTSLLHTSKCERKEKWKDIKNIDGFLIVLIKHKALDCNKINKNRSRILNQQSKLIHYETDKEQDDIDQLEKIISVLTPKEQTILQLHLAGYNNAEIAAQQNQSEKSIRNRLSESRNKLKLLWKRSYLFILMTLSWIN